MKMSVFLWEFNSIDQLILFGDRHTSLSLEMLLKLVAVFGSVVFATVSATPTVGVDLHAEQRFGPCFGAACMFVTFL